MLTSLKHICDLKSLFFNISLEILCSHYWDDIKWGLHEEMWNWLGNLLTYFTHFCEGCVEFVRIFLTILIWFGTLKTFLCVCVYIVHIHTRPLRPKEAVRSLGPWIRGVCEPFYMGAGNGTQEGPLEEQQAVLTAEPSLQDPALALLLLIVERW